jgi:hypothetical protein
MPFDPTYPISSVCPRSLRKRRRTDGGDSGDDDCDYSGKRRKPKRPSSPGEDEAAEARLFACPFFLKSPGNFNPRTTCAMSGWPKILRLKEHLFRCHYRQRFTCVRCEAEFNEPDPLAAHLRQDNRCERVDPTQRCQGSIDRGIDEYTMKQLKSRRRTASSDDYTKWFEIWKLLFPNDKAPESPCASSMPICRFHFTDLLKFLQINLRACHTTLSSKTSVDT